METYDDNLIELMKDLNVLFHKEERWKIKEWYNTINPNLGDVTPKEFALLFGTDRLLKETKKMMSFNKEEKVK